MFCAQIRAEEIRHSKKVLELTWNGVGLDKKDLLGKSDPYLELARENSDGTFSKVHRTEVGHKPIRSSLLLEIKASVIRTAHGLTSERDIYALCLLFKQGHLSAFF